MAEVRLEIKAVVVFVVLLLASSGELPGQATGALALEIARELVSESDLAASPARAMEIESVSQPAFAWAVGPWRDSRSVRLQAADFRAGGYYVRIVPDDSVSAFRLAVGHYQSEEEARRDEVALPLTVRSTAEIIPVERHVVHRSA